MVAPSLSVSASQLISNGVEVFTSGASPQASGVGALTPTIVYTNDYKTTPGCRWTSADSVNYYGIRYTLTTAIDFSASLKKVLVWHSRVNSGVNGFSRCVFYSGSGTSNYVGFLAAQTNTLGQHSRNTILDTYNFSNHIWIANVVDPNYSSPDFSGGTFDPSNVTGIEFQGRTNSAQVYCLAYARVLNSATLVNGDSGTPGGIANIVSSIYANHLMVSRSIVGVGKSYFLGCPIRLGNGGSTTTRAELIRGTLVFMPPESEHIKVSNSIYEIRINSGASDYYLLEDYTFSSLVGVDLITTGTLGVLLRATRCSFLFGSGFINLAIGTFQNCVSNGYIGGTLSGATIQGYSFNSGSGPLTLSGGTIDSLSVNGCSGNGLVLAVASGITNCSSTNNTGAGIVINTAGDYSAVDIQVSNNGTYDVYIDATVTSGQTVDISVFTFTAGSTTPTNIYWAGTTGTITVVVGQAGLTTATAGGAITLVEPLAALNAANFADDIRVYAARYQTFIIGSADINTTTDQITLGADSETGSSFAGQITPPATLAYLVAAPGATLPTSTPQIATNRLYYVVANSSGVVQISETEGGSAINFSGTGTESGGYLFSLTCSTELSNELISGGSGFSAAYTLPDGALIEVAAQGIAADESTATTLFHRIVEWSSTAGASVADTFSLANNPDAIYGQLIGSTITSKRGVAITVTSTPSSVLGITFDLSGNIELDANAITDSTLYAPDAYVWSVYQRYTEDGIRFIRNQFEALSIMEFDFNGVLTIDNIADGVRNSPATPLIVLGNLYTSVESIYAANSGTIRVEPFFVSDLTSAGDGSFTSGDRTQLDELYATLESAGVFSEAALANAPAGGGGGTPDWTADEKSQIRYRLGIDGTEAAPSTNTPELGTIDANVVSFEVDAIDADAIASSAINEIQDGLSTLTAQQVWEYSTRTLSSFGTLVADTVSAVWSAVTRSLTDRTGFSLTADERTAISITTQAGFVNEGDGQQVLAAILQRIEEDLDVTELELDTIAAANYAYFTAGSRADAFKADVSGLATTANVSAAQAAIIGQGNIAWLTATGFSTLTQSDIRSAVGLVSANLDAQLATIGTDVDTAVADTTALIVKIDTLLARLTAARAGYLDKLNVSGTLAHSDAAGIYKADVAPLLEAIEGIPTAPLLAEDYVAPDNVAIADIQKVVRADEKIRDGNYQKLEAGTDSILVNKLVVKDGTDIDLTEVV